MARGGHKCRPSPCTFCQLDYTRAEVEVLLTALLNGGTPDTAATRPDASMPGGSKPNPSRLNSLAAYLIDVQRGWSAAWNDVDGNTMYAIRMHYGDGLTHAAIGEAQGCSTSTARRRCERGVGAVLANMNGQYWHEDESEAVDGD